MNVPFPPDLPIGALLSIIHRNRNILLNEHTGRMGITAGAVGPIIYLSKHPDATQDEISRRLMIDKAAIARTIHRLEEEGCIIRIPDETNRRKFCIFMTEKGRRVAEKVIAAADTVDHEITGNLPEEAQTYLMPILRSMAYTSSTMADREFDINDRESTD
ncbi:MarR family transcriptional regulator [Methanogenium marinum]|uniref:MarR family transcriptional regulator n=1 Tax=Methanogenium marinum TaxID=348610 RepID=A0A9Q4PX87_9EURY|nr:MarR family transcriptional regulator [Methanogenium marinum]MDE4908336.1 MarR family transcriptional regulator [Methanogenium marinum]